MDYEKKHKEEVVRATQLWENGDITREQLEYIFPELKESELEDEKIRKHLLCLFQNDYVKNSSARFAGIKVKDIIAWLEKQGEKHQYWKPSEEQLEALDYAYNSCPDTERGNYYEGVLESLIDDLCKLPEKQGGQKQLNDINIRKLVDTYRCTEEYDENGNYKGKPLNCMVRAYEQGIKDVLKMVKQKPADKVEHKFNVGDEIKTSNEESLIITKIDEKGYWSEDLFICDFDEECIWDLVEQNSVDKVEPKFKVGDWITFYGGEPFKIIKVEPEQNGILDYLLLRQNGHDSYYNKKYVDENARLWTIQDAKDGDVLCYKDEISLYKYDIKNCTKQETTFGGFVYHCCYDGKRLITGSLYSLTEQDKMNIHPATKEQLNLLLQKMKEAGYEWNAEELKLEKVEHKVWESVEPVTEDDKLHLIMDEQNLAWSEEDERMFKSLKALLNDASCYSCTEGVDKILSWLKSLKERYSWKPSESDILLLERIANGKYNPQDFQASLGGLIGQLKKLREE